MRYSQMLIPTVKETPADAQVASHRLMIRSGMIRKVAAGIYTYLPLGLRVLHKISAIIRDEMNDAGAQEILMPAIQPAELWKATGRWNEYGPELLRLTDRKGAEFCVGPTHEEVITALLRDEIKSYKQLPLNLYQIQTKFRDEIRPRFGLMRGREFIMKDAYSFDLDVESSQKSYQTMFDTYHRIFKRCGLDFRPVEADTGSIGGHQSHEFQVMAETGEDAIVYCQSCEYAANVELAAIQAEVKTDTVDFKNAPQFEKVETPQKKKIEAVALFLGVEQAQVIKSLLFIMDEGLQSEANVMAMCRGDHQINEVKLMRALGAKDIRLMQDSEVFARTQLFCGYVGPINIPNQEKELKLVSDVALKSSFALVAGANEKNAHYVQVAVGRDFESPFADLRSAEDGDLCGRCGGVFKGARGIEVGHIFQLGTKYSKSLEATVLREDGESTALEMGCYGIGVSRIAAAAIEQKHDDSGAIWPIHIAPFEVALLALGKDEAVQELSERIYAALKTEKIDVLLDDRDTRPGSKFKDHDLIGIPVRVSIGARGLKDGIVEVKKRSESREESRKIGIEEASQAIISLVKAMRAEV